MNIEEFRMRAYMGSRGADADAFLRRLELAKIYPEFPVDRAQETSNSLRARGSGWSRRIFSWATRRASKG
jgi:hypothetical protein